MSERMENGFSKFVQTNTILVIAFVMVFGYFLGKQESVTALIEEGMVEDPKKLADTLVKFFSSYQIKILTLLITTPILCLMFFKLKNRKQQTKSCLTDALVPTEE